MVDVPLSTLLESADTIDALFECAFGDRNMSAQEMRDALNQADTLRESWESIEQSPTPRFNPGDTVYDRDGAETPLTVVANLQETAGNVEIPGTEDTVIDRNPGYSDDDGVVAVVYPHTSKTYYFPESRLER